MRIRPLIILACALVASLELIVTPAARASFGLSSFSFSIDSAPPAGAQPGAAGPPDIQAGSHPFQASASFAFNLTTNSQGETIPEGAVKDLQVELPPGLIGSVNGIPQCLQETFEQSACPASAQVGTLTLDTTLTDLTLPVFNIKPPPGVPLRLGVFALLVPVIMDGSVRTGSDYGLTLSLRNLPQFLPLVGGSLTLWGVPAESGHNSLRGSCLQTDGSSSGECPSNAPLRAFVTLPSSCGVPPQMTIRVDSWENPETFVESKAVPRDGEGNALSLVGCEKLAFTPSVEVESESTAADTPSGVAVEVRIPQNENPDGLSAADLREAVVTLPAGVSINPAVADGLSTCSTQEIGLENSAEPSCPDASRIGSVAIESPLLASPLQGSIYLAAPYENAFGSLLAIYVTAEQDGVLVKLGGRLVADAETGQITLTLGDVPQLPFSDFTLTFEGGPHAPLATPTDCGTFATTAQLTSYSAPGMAVPAASSGGFVIERGCGAGFAPSFLAGATSALAGSDTGLALQLTRADGEQPIQSLSATLPPGLLAHLGDVPVCAEAQAAAGTCGAASQVGSIAIAAGAGSEPFYFAGQVFLTGPYDGAPFGLSIVVPGIAGPFNLGTVIVRATISIDSQNAHLAIATDSFPRILQGIPLRIRGIYLNIDRPGFMLDPTNCERRQISATALDAAGAEALLSSPFEVAGCAGLSFSPSLSASTTGLVTRTGGADLDVEVRNPPGTQANLHAISIGFPKQLSPKLTAIQAACTQATFAANPASCPPAAIVGRATVRTPILGVALKGPVYLVSGARETLPRLALMLQGEGVVLQIVGSLRVSDAHVTAATFTSMPDAPISSFALSLPRGRHSALGASFLGKARGSLCGRKLTMPTTITGQNGAAVEQKTKIDVEGCKPAVYVLKHKVKGSTATVQVEVPSAGTLTATGSGITPVSKTSAKAKTVTLNVTLDQHGRHLLPTHPKRRLKVELALRFTPKHGKRIMSHVVLLMW